MQNKDLEICKNKMLELVKTNVPFTNSSEANGLIYKMIYINYFLRKNGNYNKEQIIKSQDIIENLLSNSNDTLYQEVVTSLNNIPLKYFESMFTLLDDIPLESFKDLILLDYETSIYNMSTPSGINDLSFKILETIEGNKILDICSFYGNFLTKYAYEKPNYNYYGNEVYPVATLVYTF